MTTQAPNWAVRGPRPWILLIWLPVCYSLLISPVADPEPGPRSPWAWLAAVGAGAVFTAAVLSRYRREAGLDRVRRLLLGLLAVLAVVTTAVYSSAWSSLFILLAIGVGVVLIDRRTPVLILAVAALAVATLFSAGASSGSTLTTGFSVLLSGLGSYAVTQLFVVVQELQCTRQELARLAVAQERERFARDLHDLLGHTMSVIVVKAEAVRRLVPLDSAAAVVHAGDIETIGRQALTDIRRAVTGYRGAGLDRELVSARVALDAAGINLRLERWDDAGSLPEDTDALLGWVVREGVTNVVRHAQATHCAITLARTELSTRLTIDDDGRGDDQISGTGAGTGNGAGAGVGLLGLAERVAAAGAMMDVTRTGPGFRIVVEVPLMAELVAP
jgi:two-component system sensor histidine kinase DesK